VPGAVRALPVIKRAPRVTHATNPLSRIDLESGPVRERGAEA
jgi:hypothetical protein